MQARPHAITSGKTSVALLFGAAVLLSGCNDTSVASSAPPEPPEVSVVTLKAQPRSIVRELPGRIAPLRVADVRPRVSGIILGRTFDQGREVKAGEPLYQIDPKPFEVELQAAEAALAKAEAALLQASQHANRVDTLAKSNAASQAANEVATANLAQAKAELSARNAEVARAQLNLSYATIRAPITGIIGAALLSEGVLVVQNEAHALATIQQIDSVYADFTQSVNELNRLRRDFDRGDLDAVASDAAKVKLVLDDGSIYPLDGKLLFSDAQGRCRHRTSHPARRIQESEARTAARHVRPRPDRTGPRSRCHYGAAAGDPAQPVRRQRSLSGEGRQPHSSRSRCAPVLLSTASGW